MAQHFLPHAVFRFGNVGQTSVVRKSAAGKKADVGVIPCDRRHGFCARKRQAGGDDAAARADAGDAVFTERLQRLDAVGDDQKVALIGEIGQDVIGAGGSIEKNHVAVLHERRRLFTDHGFFVRTFHFTQQKRNFQRGGAIFIQRCTAVGALEQMLLFQPCQVTADGLLAGVQAGGKRVHRHGLFPQQNFQNGFFPFVVHVSP